MTAAQRVATAAAGTVLVVFGLAFGFIGSIYMSSDNSGDGIWNWEPNYGISQTFGAISVALICFGLAAVVWSIWMPRRVIPITVAIGFVLFGVTFAHGMLVAGSVFVGLAVAIGVAVHIRVAPTPDSVEDADSQYPTATR